MKLLIVAALFTLAAADDRIIGGTMASPGDAPYIANLRQWDSQFCGATLVTSRWLVSAAHCYVQAKKITVTVGDFDLSVVEPQEQTETPSQCIKHPNYDSRTLANDIMMIDMGTPFTLTSYVQPAVLPASTADTVYNGEECLICGWGNTLTSGTNYPDELYCVDGVQVIPKVQCNAPNSYDGEILDGMICVGVMDGGKDSCQGDSGGPVLCSGVLHGVVSWGYGCAEPNYPGVYTDVTYFREWIGGYIGK